MKRRHIQKQVRFSVLKAQILEGELISEAGQAKDLYGTSAEGDL